MADHKYHKKNGEVKEALRAGVGRAENAVAIEKMKQETEKVYGPGSVVRPGKKRPGKLKNPFKSYGKKSREVKKSLDEKTKKFGEEQGLKLNLPKELEPGKKKKKKEKGGPSEKLKADRKKPGGSNAGKYPNVPKNEFAGPAGGSPAGTYPINTKKRAKSAIKLAHNAPNPGAIKKKARKVLDGK